MRGVGSGRKPKPGSGLVENVLCLRAKDIPECSRGTQIRTFWGFERNGLLIRTEVSGNDHMYELHCSLLREDGRSAKLCSGLFSIEERQTNVGGTRRFFICPDCGARRTKLYLKRHVACRKCLDLVYRGQRLAKWERAMYSVAKITSKLGNDRWDRLPPRPDHVSRRRYERMRNEYERYTKIWVAHYAAFMNIDRPPRVTVDDPTL